METSITRRSLLVGDSKAATVYEQNSNGQRFVTIGNYDFNWKLVRGKMEVFHPAR